MSEWNKEEAQKAAMEDVIAAARSFVATADEFWPDYPPAVAESLDALDSAWGNLGAIDDVDELREALKDDVFTPILPIEREQWERIGREAGWLYGAIEPEGTRTLAWVFIENGDLMIDFSHNPHWEEVQKATEARRSAEWEVRKNDPATWRHSGERCLREAQKYFARACELEDAAAKEEAG